MVTVTSQLNRNDGEDKADSLRSLENDFCCSCYPLSENSKIKSSGVYFCEDTAVSLMLVQIQDLVQKQQSCKALTSAEVPCAKACKTH